MSNRQRSSRSWDNVADWYSGWSGPNGSYHHQRYAIPALMDLLRPTPQESILDLGCGPGPLAPAVMRNGAEYTGIDLSPRLIAVARRHHKDARFAVANVTHLNTAALPGFGEFTAVTFLLSLQDIDPLEAAIASAASALKPGGRLIILMTHPCFRIPRQSGWGWDEGRQLRYRRIDSYLSSLDVPMHAKGPKGPRTTRSFHRPLGDYFEALSESGFVVDAFREIAVDTTEKDRKRAQARADREFPLFLALRAFARE